MTPSLARNALTIPRKKAKQIRQRIGYLNQEQIERLLQTAKEYGPREHCMILLALSHGLRASEICNLKLEDVNLKTRQISIKRLKNSLDGVQDFLHVKGNSLFDEGAVLKTWMDARKPDGDTYLFNSQCSTQISRVQVYRLFNEIAKRADIPEGLRHPHVLKHSLAVAMVKKNVSAFTIQQMLGHRSIQSTLVYAKSNDQDASAARNQVFNSLF